MPGTGRRWQTAKYAAGAAAPYLSEAYKPTTDMPLEQKPVEYRQYKVRRRPDLSYEYTALPVSTQYTPNFAEGGGVSDLVGQYIDPAFRIKDVSGPPKIKTTTNMPELKLADGGRITPEEFYQMYMKKDPASTPELKYGAKGYADNIYSNPTDNPYIRTQPTPAAARAWEGKVCKATPPS